MARAPLGLIARERVGTVRAGLVIAFMVQWSVCREKLGRSPTLEQYADYWGESVRTAYRRQEYFRLSFPGELTPDALLDEVEARWDRREGVRGLQGVPVAA